MPLYEYRCDACEHQFEVIQSFSDKPLRKCDACGGKLRKLVSRAGFVLKGGGWYKTDYAGAARPKAAPDDAKPAAPAKGDTGDGKPATAAAGDAAAASPAKAKETKGTKAG